MATDRLEEQKVATPRLPVATMKPEGSKSGENVHDFSLDGLKQLYPLDDKLSFKPDVDIILVPGLGEDPEKSCRSAKTGWNWVTSPDGITKDFPKARVLLYTYESAWVGSFKPKWFINNIAQNLLMCLRKSRENCNKRPIVFIGHGIGGLVISKAAITANVRRDAFPVMFEAISATIFFGTPFKGAELASWGAMHAHILERVNETTSSKPLDFIKLGDMPLKELREEFMRIIGGPTPSIRMVCFWEQQQSDLSNIANLLVQSGIHKSLVPKAPTNLVNRGSATLDGVSHSGVASSHRDLVKFDGPKDERWHQKVREHLKGAINGAWLLVQDRVALAKEMDWSSFTQVMQALRGTQVDKKRRDLEKAIAPSSWITEDPEYVKWIEMENDQGEAGTSTISSVVDCLWICGREGRGKTGTTIASLRGIETLIGQTKAQRLGHDEILFAYFFCDSSTECCTAEHLLKSLLSQLIKQQAVLAYHAKPFIRTSVNNCTPNTRAQATVENLWKCLQNMLFDKAIGHRVYIVINNLHALPAQSNSTMNLMAYLSSEMQNAKRASRDSPSWRVSTRWLITSRNNQEASGAAPKSNVRLIDLDGKYGSKVQRDLQKYAKEKVAILEIGKKYNKALAYFASSLMGMRAPDVHWIDITCIQLQRLSKAESHLKVRRILEDTPQDLNDFLNEEWRRIFAVNDENGEKMREMLRALILAYECPTEAELGVLAGFSATYEDQEELHNLIERCKPLLSVKHKVSFMNSTVKTHLLEHSRQILGLSFDEIKWQHGILALRSLSHLKEKFQFQLPEQGELAMAIKRVHDATVHQHGGNRDVGLEANTGSFDSGEGGLDSIYDAYSDLEDSKPETKHPENDDYPEAGVLKSRALPYPVKYWLRHGSKATVEFAEDLSLDDDFWRPDSLTRYHWLLEYTNIANDFNDLDVKSMTALHVVAAIGFRQLISALIRHGHEKEMNTYDSLSNTPVRILLPFKTLCHQLMYFFMDKLHLAAAFGRSKIIDELLDHGTLIEGPEQRGDDTPLHMAAEIGHVDAMKRLILRGADVNKYSQDSGLVINTAISTGKLDAIELLLQKGATLSINGDEVRSPLAQAAAIGDVSVVELLIQSFAGQLSPHECSKALISAAGNGKVETFNRIVQFQHTPEDFQLALDEAAEGAKWEIVKISLEKGSNLNCNKAFYRAAIGTNRNPKVLVDLWEHTRGRISRQALNESLFGATDHGDDSTVKILLGKFGADSNATRDKSVSQLTGKEDILTLIRYGNSLTAAAYHGRIDILRLLLDASADIKSPHGWPLQAAATQGYKEIVEELLGRGADVNALTTNPNCRSGTALQGATENGKFEIVELLLQHGAKPDLGGGINAPPVLAAAIYAEEKILSRLVNAGANVNVFGANDHSTPLINASRFIKGTETLQSLLKAGADINATNKDGKTALIAAAEQGDGTVVQFLLNNGADIIHTMDNGMNALKAALGSNVTDCVEILVGRVSFILSVLKAAGDSGDMAVISIIEAATKPPVQALEYDCGKEAVSTYVHSADNRNSVNGNANARTDQQETHGSYTDKTTDSTAKDHFPSAKTQPRYVEQSQSKSSRDQKFSPYHRRSVSLTPRPRTPRRFNTERPYEGARWSPPPPIPQQVYSQHNGNAISAGPTPPGSIKEDTPSKRKAIIAGQGLSDCSSFPVIPDFRRSNTAPLVKAYKAYTPGVRRPPAEDNVPTREIQEQLALSEEPDKYNTSSMAVNYDSGSTATPLYPEFSQLQENHAYNGDHQIYTAPQEQYQHFSPYLTRKWTPPSDPPYQDTFSYADYTEAATVPRRPSTQLFFTTPTAQPLNQRNWTPPIPSPSPPVQHTGPYMNYNQMQCYDNRNDGTQHPGSWQPPRAGVGQEGYSFAGVKNALSQARGKFGGRIQMSRNPA